MDKLNREIIRLSVPTIVSNITVPLLGICDTAISGHLGSELYLSAIAVGSVMLNVVFWIFGFLRGGTTGLTANALGKTIDREDGNNPEKKKAKKRTIEKFFSNGKNGEEHFVETSKVLYRALLIALGAGVVLIALQHPIFLFLNYVAGSGQEIEDFVENYFVIRIWGAPALLATMAISGWFVGMQTTFYPMLIAILMNLINIGASCALVFGAGYGFNGVAIGTLLSNWLGLLVSIACLLWFCRGRFPRCQLQLLMKGEWWKYFSVNGNLFLRSFFIICVTMGVTAAGARLGNLTLAINVIVMQFFQFFSFFMDGFAFSGEAMVGLRSGQGDYVMLKKCVNRLLQWTLVTALIFSAIYFSGTGTMASLLTDSKAVVDGVKALTICIGLIPLVSCWAFIYDGFYIGITDTFKMMVSTLLGSIAFFVIIFGPAPDTLANFNLDGNIVIWTGFLCYLLFRGFYLAMLWPSSLRKQFG